MKRPLWLAVFAVIVVLVVGMMLIGPCRPCCTESRRSVSVTKLYHVFLAVGKWRQAHDGNYPPNLRALFDAGYIDEATLVDPADKTPPMRDGIKCSYEYVGLVPTNIPAETIIAYNRKDIFKDGRNVLSNDGAVFWQSEEHVADPKGLEHPSLPASYKAVVKAYGKDLTDEINARLKKFYEIE